jgi:hypothetical protein
MVIDLLVKAETGVAQFVELVCILDVVADLVVDDACGFDEPTEGGRKHKWRKIDKGGRIYLVRDKFPFSPMAFLSLQI